MPVFERQYSQVVPEIRVGLVGRALRAVRRVREDPGIRASQRVLWLPT